MPTTIDSAGITFNDATSLTSAVIPANAVGSTQIANGSVTAAKLGTDEQKQIAKAWVNFNGDLATPGSGRSSYNVSSVTRTATGNYTVNFLTEMADTNYSAFATSYDSGYAIHSAQLNTFTTASINVDTFSYTTLNTLGSSVNSNPISVIIFGN